MASDPSMPVKKIQEYPDDKKCDPAAGDIVFGHVPYDYKFVASVVARPAPAVYPVVWLRHPLKRIVSFANFLKVSVDDFRRKITKLSCNQQTNMINGVPFSGGGCGVGVTRGEGFDKAWNHFRGSCSNNHRFATLEGIRRLNDEFVVVGHLENFKGSLFLLQRAFGWPRTIVEGALTHKLGGFCMGGQCATEGKWKLDDLGEAAVAAMRKREKCDMALWEHSQRLVEARLQTMSSDDVAAFGKFKAFAETRDALAQRKEDKQRGRLKVSGPHGHKKKKRRKVGVREGSERERYRSESICSSGGWVVGGSVESHKSLPYVSPRCNSPIPNP